MFRIRQISTLSPAVNLRESSAGLPTVVVQEGGYRTTSLGQNARQFFLGLAGEEPRP